MHALVIEDQFLIATLIEDELADLGYLSCEIVDNEAAAVDAARAIASATASRRRVPPNGLPITVA